MAVDDYDSSRTSRGEPLVLNAKKRCASSANAPYTPITQMIHLLKEGKLREAGNMLFANNPLSVICSLVCSHQAECEGHCI